MIRSWKDVGVDFIARVFKSISSHSVFDPCSSYCIEVLTLFSFPNQLLVIGLKSLIGFVLLFVLFVFMEVRKNELS